MFLKSLELNGFKSFASKTTLEFPAGITAIVGPNGSGKSNIIDCVRWLLGEREAKNLRGTKIEDLIWNGTPKRPRVSMAQAGLHFDNGSGFFPVDFKEVAVSRRVGRDGNSEYFLNKSEVRLKDIIDFFSRSRLGTKGLTIIGQGSSDLFVRVSSEERRVMVEEILGLREFQLKRIEAERKLKNTHFNLEKVKAMIQEVAPRLRLLKKQTVRWSKRRSLDEELKELEKGYFSFRLKEIGDGEDKIKPRLVAVERDINEKQRQLKGLEAEIKKIESQPKEYEEIKNIKEAKNRILALRSQVEKELGRLEGKLEFLSSAQDEEVVFKNNDLVKLLKDVKKNLSQSVTLASIDSIKKNIEDLVGKIDDFFSPNKSAKGQESELSELKKSRDALMEKFGNLEKQIKELDERERVITSRLEDFNKQFQKNFEQVESERKALRYLEDQRNKILFDQERFRLKQEELDRDLAEINRKASDFNLQGATGVKEEELHGMEKRMFRLRTELASIGDVDEALIKEAEEVESHYGFLTNQSKDLEQATADLKKMIKELGEKIHLKFSSSLKLINTEFNKFFRLMFGGGSAKLKLKKYEAKISAQGGSAFGGKNNGEEGAGGDNSESTEEKKTGELDDEDIESKAGVEIELSLPKKRITGLEMLSGGERSLVSIAALFSLIAVSPPPFLVLDEIDAALDESNSTRFANLVKEFSKKTQFLIATHNRATMEVADLLYGVTMSDDGSSKVYSLKLENVSPAAVGKER